MRKWGLVKLDLRGRFVSGCKRSMGGALCALLLCFSFPVFGKNSCEYLEGKIARNNCRYRTFRFALDLLSARNARTIVETGTARYGALYFDSDGGSTIIFAEWARDHEAEFFSIDLSIENLANASSAVISYVPNYQDKIHYICSDSVSYLSQFNRTVDFLYLDSFDYELDNPLPSQEHHLKEIQAVYPYLTENSVVMIDDCDLPGGGKGKQVIDFLLNKGWHIVKSGYQVILIR